MWIMSSALGQSADAEKKAPEDWFNLDAKADKVQGVSTGKAYQELLKNSKVKPVIVAVIDGGTDVNHEDLKPVIWVNEKEIPNNGIDDDKNGYVDDIHGWNFIGGKDTNVHYDNLEVTRLYRTQLRKFENVNTEKLSESEKKEYEQFQKIKSDFEKESKEAQSNYFTYQILKEGLDKVKKQLGKETVTLADVKTYKTTDPVSEQVKQITEDILGKGESFEELVKQIQQGAEHFEQQAKYHVNPEFDPRGIVGDNYADLRERVYGNNDVAGPDADHGTHVAGIIAAVRDNNLGIKGVSNTARIMVVRVVPQGDERDKDVANAIRYAVDNGAKVVNMSFGKSYSPNKDIVDEAVKYAASKDVLLVHAAGNDGQDNDQANNFPNDEDASRKEIVNNWVEVGASSWKAGQETVGNFSNYGKNSVDVFAPGVDIYSTIPGSKYTNHNGTSMAAPVVSGIAALIRAHYPKLTAVQVKEILMKSAIPYKTKVLVPGSQDQQASLSDISRTGGIVNAYEALKLAKQMGMGKAKPKS